VLFGGSSLMDTAPLKRLIARHITEETLARVAAEHAKGRWLLAGATNLDTGQLWVFVLSALAREGGPQALETFRNILLAAASPPVAFPPVEIFGYLFADGATVDNHLIAGLAGKTKRFPPEVPKGQVWLIHNGRLSSPAKAHAVPLSLVPILSKTLTISMDAQMGSSLVRAYVVTRAHRYGFNLLEVPGDVEMGQDALAFDHGEMVRLFDTGRELGRRPESWAQEPPVTPEVSPHIIEALKRIPPFLTE
jgi:predicted acylesterase/phospholipase RssA